MVTGNFALIAGIEPGQVEEWYLAVYADAYEWVELPNTHGMALFADGGLLASKPYAASGAYIDRMSDYCRGCAYDVRKKTGPGACPFNLLYWRFMIGRTGRARRQPAHGHALPDARRHAAARRLQIAREADGFLDGLSPDPDDPSATRPAQLALDL